MYPPPRPVQVPLGMVIGHGGQNYLGHLGGAGQQMGGHGAETVSMQVGPQGVTLTSGGTPVSFRTPSASVIVSASQERLHRGSISRPMFPDESSNRTGYSGHSGTGHSGHPEKHSGKHSEVTPSAQSGIDALVSLLGGTNIHISTGGLPHEVLQGHREGREAGQSHRGHHDPQSLDTASQQSGQHPTAKPGKCPAMQYRTLSASLLVTSSNERLRMGGGGGGIRSRPTSPVQGGAPKHEQGRSVTIHDNKGVAEVKAPIIMSQPVSKSSRLAPQVEHLLLNGMPGYSETVVLIFMPNADDERRE